MRLDVLSSSQNSPAKPLAHSCLRKLTVVCVAPLVTCAHLQTHSLHKLLRTPARVTCLRRNIEHRHCLARTSMQLRATIAAFAIDDRQHSTSEARRALPRCTDAQKRSLVVSARSGTKSPPSLHSLNCEIRRGLPSSGRLSFQFRMGIGSFVGTQVPSPCLGCRCKEESTLGGCDFL